MRIPSHVWLCAPALLACGLVPLWPLSGPPALPSPSPAAVIDPLPIQRVPLDAEQLAREMERVRKGLLVQMPRADFEERVRHAARAQITLKQPPRLIEAYYRARLAGSALVGTGRWNVIHAGPAAAVLPLEPLNLFLRQPRFENREALLGDFDGKGPGLLLDQPGPRAVAFDWTARGDDGPDGLHFDLKTAACAVANLELEVPAEHTVSISPDGCLLSGPFPAERPDRSLWKVGFAGRSQLHVLVRRSGAPDEPPPLVLATLKTVQELTPDFLQAEYQFDLQVPRQSIRELTCECDAELRPYDVKLPGMESWELRTGRPGSSNTLFIKMREPLQGSGLLVVRCLAPLDEETRKDSPGGKVGLHPIAWKCPGLRVAQAVPRGETLVLRLHPDVRMDEWQPNGFRLTETTAEATGWHVLTLTGGGIAPDEGEKGPLAPPDVRPTRPTARLQVSGAEYRARTVSWWQIRPGQESLTAQITYEVLQGHLFQLPVYLPAGWDVERVELSPPSLLRNWGQKQDGDRTLLTVDLHQGLATPRLIPVTGFLAPPPRLTLHLRPAPNPPHARRDGTAERPFPEVIPVGARWSEGALAIDYDERAYQATLRTPLVTAPLVEEGPWGKQLPDHFYSYRGQPLTGTLLLESRPLRLRSRVVHDVYPSGGRVLVEARLYLEAETGIPETLDLLASTPLGADWSWKTVSGGSAVRAFEHLSFVEAATLLGVLGSRTPLEAITVWAAQSGGERWRLTLTHSPRPSEPLILQLTSVVPREEGDRWHVPLLTLLGADSTEAETTVHLPRSTGVAVQTQGLSESFAGEQAAVLPPWRTFHHGSPPLRLTLLGPLSQTSGMSPPQIRRAVLTTQVMPDHLLEAFRFQMDNWREPELPLILPADATLLSVRREGERVEALVTEGPGGGHTVLLPASEPPPGDASAAPRLHCYEVLYTLPRSSGLFWDRLTAPTPRLPVEPGAFQHVWRLPPGWQPLLDGRCIRLPGQGIDAGRRTDEWIAEVPGRLTSFTSMTDWEARQRELLGETATALNRDYGAKALSLREAMDRLSFDLLKEQGPLVLHAQALHEAGLAPDTPVRIKPTPLGQEAAPPWESVGLVCIPCRAAPLMTTRRQWEIWRTGSDETDQVLDESVASAVAEAVAFGHDGSNRFRTVADWLRSERSRPAGKGSWSAESEQPSEFASLQTSNLPPGWTEWESIASEKSGAELRVVRRAAVTVAGLALAAVWSGLFGLTWLSGLARPRFTPWRLRLLLLWLAAGGLAVCWLPTALHGLAWWAWLTSIAVAALWYLGSAFRKPALADAAVVRGGGRAATAAAIVLSALASLSGWAAPVGPAESFTVFLVAGPADAPEKETVLVPAELIERLDALTRPSGGAPRGVVLLNAAYEGAITEANAEFEAVYQAHCFEDRTTLTVPLSGVQLQEEVLLDGARAYPTALDPPQGGYTLKVEGRGPHTVRLHFRIPVQIQGDNRDLHFVAPRLTQSRLILKLPTGAGDPQVPTRLGEQRVSETADGIRIEADLGRVITPVMAHWRQQSGPPRPPVVEVREAYLWDLRADGSNLKALLRYSVIQGSTSAFELDLPESLEVRSVETRAPTRGKPVPRLKESRVREANRQRQLHLEFQSAVSGEVQVLLELVPRRPFSSTATLPLPTPRDVHSVQSYLAYRLDGVEGRVKDLAHLTGPRVEEFAEFWKAGGEEEPRRLATAFTITRKAGAIPFLRLQLHIPSTKVNGTQDITWRVGRRQADFQATVQVNAPGGDLSLVEWIVPPSLNITHVGGRNVWHWSQSGSRLQVWFHQAVGAAEVQWAGWLPLDDGKKGAAELNPFQFDLPGLRLAGAGTQTTTVRAAATTGLRLTRPQPRNLVPLPDSRAAGPEYSYLAQEADYGITFQVLPVIQPLEARVLTTAEVRNRQVTFIATVECRAAQGDLRGMELRLDHWEGDDVRLEAANVAQRHEQRRDPSSRAWTLDLQPGVPNPYRVILAMTRSLEDNSAGGITVPRVSVVGAGRTEQWLAVHGPELGPESSSHLTPVAGTGPALVDWQKTWPVEAERLRRLGGAAWKVLDGPPLRLTPRSGFAGAAPVQVFLVEQSAAVADGRSWMHQATAWLYHRANIELEIALPEKATLVNAAVDGLTVVPMRAEDHHAWLHLPEEAGACRVTLRWRFEPSDEPLDAPNLAGPRFDGATESEQLWTVHVPQGYQAESTTGQLPFALAADQELRRADAHMRLSGVLAEQARGGGAQLLAAQLRFYQTCRTAELQLAGAPSDSSLGTWLQTLREQNKELARTQGFEKTRADAERQARAGLVLSETDSDGLPDGDALPERGRPLYGQARPGSAPPHIHLQTAGAVKARQNLAVSLLLLCVIAAIEVLTYFPRALGWIRRFWPEQLALLAGLLWLMDGPPVAIFGLICLAIAGRVLEVGMLAYRFGRWPAAQTPSASGTSAVSVGPAA